MALFSSSKISEGNEAIAELLKKERESKKLKLEDAAFELGINYRYLVEIEKGNFDSLPKGLYRKNYLEKYAKYLKLDAKKILEFYAKENPDDPKDKEKNIFSRKIPKAHYFFTIPKIIKNILIVFLVLICVGYLVFYLNNIIKPPQITVLNPQNDFTTEENFITVIGQTEPETEIVINDEMVLTDSDGTFSKKINLKTGVNIITIEGQKKYSRKNTIIKKILVK